MMARTAIDRTTRLQQELKILERYFPGFAPYRRPDGLLFVEGPLRTNRGTQYAVRVLLPHDWPNGMPFLVVTHPSPLRDRRGYELAHQGPSPAMHINASIDGLPCLCLYRAERWAPTVTLYKVVMKARVWLEAYEVYLDTGRSLSRILAEQELQ